MARNAGIAVLAVGIGRHIPGCGRHIPGCDVFTSRDVSLHPGMCISRDPCMFVRMPGFQKGGKTRASVVVKPVHQWW